MTADKFLTSFKYICLYHFVIVNKWYELVTCIQQLLDNVEVGVGNTVVQGGVAIAISHVDHMLQQCGRDVTEGVQVVLHHSRHSRLLTGHTEPLVLHRVRTCPL